MKTFATSELQRLLEIMARLRSPDGGCPWDLEQNFSSIAPYTLEEAYEVADAIERDDMVALKEELGDLLLQVVFHSQMAKEAGLFDFKEVAKAINDKMVARHPHVFGDAEIKTAQAQTQNWETIKAEEKKAKGHTSVLDDIPLNLPALSRAQKLTKKAAKIGFDWPEISPVFDKLQEEIMELQEAIASGNRSHAEEELGDVLFVCVNLARHIDADAESALRYTNQKFERRFRYVETHKNEHASLEEMDALWNDAKKSGV